MSNVAPRRTGKEKATKEQDTEEQHVAREKKAGEKKETKAYDLKWRDAMEKSVIFLMTGMERWWDKVNCKMDDVARPPPFLRMPASMLRAAGAEEKEEDEDDD